MVRSGWMAHGASHMWTCMHMCMCCTGVWFPVSLSGTHAPQNLSAWDSCIAVWVHHTHTACATHEGSVCWGGASCVVDRWIMHAYAPRMCATRTWGVPASTLTCTGGKCLLGGCPMGCGSCMYMHHTYTHTHACTQHTHVHGMLTHAHSCCMLITHTRTHTQHVGAACIST